MMKIESALSRTVSRAGTIAKWSPTHQLRWRHSQPTHHGWTVRSSHTSRHRSEITTASRAVEEHKWKSNFQELESCGQLNWRINIQFVSNERTMVLYRIILTAIIDVECRSGLSARCLQHDVSGNKTLMIQRSGRWESDVPVENLFRYQGLSIVERFVWSCLKWFARTDGFTLSAITPVTGTLYRT